MRLNNWPQHPDRSGDYARGNVTSSSLPFGCLMGRANGARTTTGTRSILSLLNSEADVRGLVLTPTWLSRVCTAGGDGTRTVGERHLDQPRIDPRL